MESIPVKTGSPNEYYSARDFMSVKLLHIITGLALLIQANWIYSQDYSPDSAKQAEIRVSSFPESPGKLPADLFLPQTPPPNDSCAQAEILSGPFPLSGSGSTIDATVDCPAILNWAGIWYVIELPYSSNDIALTVCGTAEDIVDIGVVLMADCSCSDYINISEFSYLDDGQCPTSHAGFEVVFESIPQTLNPSGVAYLPVYVVNENSQGLDFEYQVDVTEAQPPPVGDSCDDPIIIAGLPFIDNRNSCQFNNNYNFGGRDVVYNITLDSCLVIEISLCNTDPVFDTYLLVYDESGCGQIPIATDDDGCMPPGQYGTSAITDTLQAGIYYVVVDAYSGECGPYELTIDGRVCEIPGACCVESACIGTLLRGSCDSLGGQWYSGEDCDAGFNCPGACENYLLGDVNMFNGSWPPQAIGSDVTYLVNYFRGLPSSQPCFINGFWGSADVNGDCVIIGSDVTRIVNYFRGTTTIAPCPDHQPCWLSSDDVPPESPVNWPDCDNIPRQAY